MLLCFLRRCCCWRIVDRPATPRGRFLLDFERLTGGGRGAKEMLVVFEDWGGRFATLLSIPGEVGSRSDMRGSWRAHNESHVVTKWRDGCCCRRTDTAQLWRFKHPYTRKLSGLVFDCFIFISDSRSEGLVHNTDKLDPGLLFEPPWLDKEPNSPRKDKRTQVSKSPLLDGAYTWFHTENMHWLFNYILRTSSLLIPPWMRKEKPVKMSKSKRTG